MQFEWVDGHCHLADPRLAQGLDALLARSRAAGVGAWVQGGVDPDDWDRQRALQERLGPALVTAFGLHPWWVAKADAEALARGLRALERALPDASAAGEMGLDHHPNHGGNLPLQAMAFERQLDLALRFSKPLVLHIVQAHPEAIQILQRRGPFPAGGLVHAFNGSAQTARAYLDMGLTLSVGSAVLRPGYKMLKAALPTIPADRLVLETDCPDGAAGPEGLVAIAEAVAGLQKRLPVEVLTSSTLALKALFRMK